jgi:hypothetical protein
MKCKYCKAEITLVAGRLLDDCKFGAAICPDAPKGVYEHALPEAVITDRADLIRGLEAVRDEWTAPFTLGDLSDTELAQLALDTLQAVGALFTKPVSATIDAELPAKWEHEVDLDAIRYVPPAEDKAK